MLTPLSRRILPLLFLALSAACSDSPTSASSTPGFTSTDVRPGGGNEVGGGNVLTVHYTGWLFDAAKTEQKGLQFETSRGTEAFAFTLGAGQVISGWDQGLVGMKVGGLRRLVIPPALAYGMSRNGVIPSNATLVFEIELVAAQ